MNFNSCVHRCFDGVTKTQGLTIASSKSSVVTFRKGNIELRIAHDSARTYELNLTFVRQLPTASSEYFTLDRYLEMIGDSDAAWVAQVMVSKEEDMLVVVERLSRIVERHSSDLFDDSPKACALSLE